MSNKNSKIFQNPKKIEFILISTFCRLPSIISSTIVGEYFSEGNWKVSMIVYGVTFILTIIALLIVRIFDKDKITEKALHELK